MNTRTLSVALALVGLVAAPGCRKTTEPHRITVSGHVEATDVRVSAKIGGRLSALVVKEGDIVRGGQTIARIDTIDIDLALAGARAERASAAADLQLKENGPQREDIAQAQAQARNLLAQVDGAQRELDRMQQLLDSGSGTTRSRDDALTRRDALKEQLAGAEQLLAKLRGGFRREEIDAARARVAGADAKIAQLEQQRHDAETVSPTAGVVTEKAAEQGELLPPGALIVVVTDLADAWLTAYLGEPDLGRVRLGEPVSVRTDDGQHRTGHVSFISTEAEFTPKNVQTAEERLKLVYKIKIALPNGDGLFKPGMPAQAEFAAAEIAR